MLLSYTVGDVACMLFTIVTSRSVLNFATVLLTGNELSFLFTFLYETERKTLAPESLTSKMLKNFLND